MPRYDAVIFDLDGTLLDTLDDLMDAVNHALAQMDFPPPEPSGGKHLRG